MYSASAAPLLRPIPSDEAYPRQAAALCPTRLTSPTSPKDATQPLERGKGTRLGQHGRGKASPTGRLSPSRRSLRCVANEGGKLRAPYIYMSCGKERKKAEGEAEKLETAGLRAELSDGRHRSYFLVGSNAGSSDSSCTHGRTCCPYSRDTPASGRRHSSSSLPPPRGELGRGARRENASW